MYPASGWRFYVLRATMMIRACGPYKSLGYRNLFSTQVFQHAVDCFFVLFFLLSRLGESSLKTSTLQFYAATVLCCNGSSSRAHRSGNRVCVGCKPIPPPAAWTPPPRDYLKVMSLLGMRSAVQGWWRARLKRTHDCRHFWTSQRITLSSFEKGLCLDFQVLLCLVIANVRVGERMAHE
jgi:hypothetical protein